MSSKFSSSFFKKSPLNVTVATGYVSTRDSLQRMFDDITKGTVKALEGASDPQIQADRLDRRITNRNERAAKLNKKANEGLGRKIDSKTGDVTFDPKPQTPRQIEKAKKARKKAKKITEKNKTILTPRYNKAKEKADSEMTKKLKEYEDLYDIKNPSEVDFRLRLNEGQKIYNENKTTADKNWEDLSMAEKTQFVTQAKIYPIK